jgi:TRAP-type mannitol/chloroaromatic compound transport system permease small subunit
MDPSTPIPPPAGEPRPPLPVRIVDAMSETAGRIVLWLVAAMVVIGAFNAVARYAGRWTGTNLSSNAYLELQWYLFSVVFLLGASYGLRHDAHVRVDVLYGRLGERGRALIDLVGTVVFLLPFSIFMLVASWPSVAASWRVKEISPDPGGLPRYPIKTLLLVAFLMLILQGAAEAWRRVAILRRPRGDGAAAGSER